MIRSLWRGSATGFCAVFAFSAIEMFRGCDVGIANDPFAVCFFASIVAVVYGLPVGICTALLWWKLRGRVHYYVPIAAVLAAIVVPSLLPAHHVPGNCVI